MYVCAWVPPRGSTPGLIGMSLAMCVGNESGYLPCHLVFNIDLAVL